MAANFFPKEYHDMQRKYRFDHLEVGGPPMFVTGNYETFRHCKKKYQRKYGGVFRMNKAMQDGVYGYECRRVE